MGCPVEWECSARAEVARSQLHTDLWCTLIQRAKVLLGGLCKSRSNLCRGCGKSPLIFLRWEPGPLGVLEVGVICLLDEKWF